MYIAIPIVEKFIEVALIKNFTNDMPCIEAKGILYFGVLVLHQYLHTYSKS